MDPEIARQVADELRRLGVMLTPEQVAARAAQTARDLPSLLLPWEVRPEHRWDYTAMMLRALQMRRRGEPLRPRLDDRLDRFLDDLASQHQVIDYRPDLGFMRVPRLSTDWQIMREP
ncbi:MAG: hypothetical protein ACOYY2_03005 [Actinomycetota bacterium]